MGASAGAGVGVVNLAHHPHVTIDMRMLGVSGVGTYVEELVPRVISRWVSARFTLLGNAGAIACVVPASDRVAIRDLDVPIYSIREQVLMALAIPRRTTLFWAPHYNIPVLFTGRIAATVHDVFHLADAQSSLTRTLYARAMFSALVARARVVFCDSAFTALELRRLAGVPRRLAVIPLGVSPRWFRVSTAAPPIAEPYLLALGNVKPHKNLKRLVAAFGMIADRIPHRLVIVGRREGLRTLDTEVEGMAASLGDRVLFTGMVGSQELVGWMANCAALVQPSLYEGFGLPPLEAMACGRRVAVARTSSLPEVCGAEATYFDPLDTGSIARALEIVAWDSADEAADTQRRRAWARGFDWDLCAEATLQQLTHAAESDA
jgi:glycosyltransferase involved in cell wall biosynthesis